MRSLFAAVVAISVCEPALVNSKSRCELVDPVRIENYAFNNKGFVAVTIGTKDRITPPLWYWRIRDERLQLSDRASIQQEFTLLGVRDGILTVRRQCAEIVRFRYQFEH